MKLQSFACGAWFEASDGFAEVRSAIDGRTVALASSRGLDVAAMVRYARAVGGPNLRALTFRDRAAHLKALATYLNERREALYALSFETGATQRDHLYDVDGGIGTLFAYASRGRRELPARGFVIDGDEEPLSKRGGFVGRHVFVPRHGVAVQINAFNFPCWGMLEKFAPAYLAGMPVIVKPATATSYVTEALVRMTIESGVLPDGAVQLIAGGVGDLLDHLDGQDVLSFTGSLATSQVLRDHPTVSREAVRFIAERDSLNAAVLGPDAADGSPEFDLFINEVVTEMTVKAGQKCTAIRRAFVPRAALAAAEVALKERLATIVVGNPRTESVRMGALASIAQRDDVRTRVAELRREAELVFGDPDRVDVAGADASAGAFMSPVLLRCDDPATARAVHEVEAFGPVCTLMPYDTVAEAVRLVCRGAGSLVASVFTYDADVARELVLGIAPYHGRILVVDRDDARESTGHGSPLPGLIHGGPGRAGGSEELGGLRGVYHYMQRTALQGSPERLASLTREWTRRAAVDERAEHPFRAPFGDLHVGRSILTASRIVSLEDIERFAAFTGDTFYAHMDEAAATANPFFGGRVAHGYLVLAFAAGLFVDPAPGPVLANYGLDRLRFTKPVRPGDAIHARLTVKAKEPRNDEYGEVRWDVEVMNQRDETVASYELLTLNAVAVPAGVAG